MNTQAIGILFLKDLFLSRKPLFAYFVGGICSSGLACVPNETVAFTGSILSITVAIGAGMHLIGGLLLGETIEQTRIFVMSLPISLMDYSIAKIAVVLTTYLIPWSAMLACSMILHYILPESKQGTVAIIPVIFLYLLGAFTIQLVTAVLTESIGWTIFMVVCCNVLLNVFLKKLYSFSAIIEAAESDVLIWPPLVQQILLIELLIIVSAIAIAITFQARKRDLI